MKTSSAKSKGRKLQQWLAALLIETANDCQITLTPKDIRSTSMGVGGPDVQMSEAATAVYPFDFECKNEADPQNIYGRYFKFQEKHSLPTIAVFKRTNRSKSSEPIFVFSRQVLNIICGGAMPTVNYAGLTSTRCNVLDYYEDLMKGGATTFEYSRSTRDEPIFVVNAPVFKHMIRAWLRKK